jgi:hypothetical protein
MSKPIEGEPAFPSPAVGTGDPRDGMTTGHAGMSLRQYYIGQALQGFCANPDLTQASYRDVAGRAITQADEIMKLLYPQPKETN